MGWNEFLEGVGNDLRNDLVVACPVDTGHGQNSISYDVVGDEIVISMVGYLMYVEHGTPPHTIETKNKKVLSDGKRFFGKKVKHPGTRPNPFIRTTMHQKLKGIFIDNSRRHLD